jgi:dihydrofolate synthase/folylpolyglutamate synthase
MKNYEESLRYIYGLIKFGIKLGLENPRKVLSLAGNPHRSFKSIHIAGTNGKGSTSRILQAALMALGLRTGLFTSPHMVRFTERIVVDHKEISPDEVVTLTGALRGAISHEPDLRPTYFEFVTALAFKYFKQKAVQWAVVETGMGGRFDATNVLTPEVSVITTVGLDHRQYLGETIQAIAFEKAGIIKDAVPVVIGPMPEEARKVILGEALSKTSEIRLYSRDFRCEVKKVGPEGTVFDLYTDLLDSPVRDLFVPLVGAHQAINATLAAEAFLLAVGTQERAIQALKQGLKEVRIEGRFEVVEHSGRRFILDGAHNGQAMEALFETLKVFGPDIRPITVFGVMADKDISDMLTPVVRSSKVVILTRPAYERAEETENLYRLALELVPEIKDALFITHTVKEAIKRAMQMAGTQDLILVTGSFYVVGEAKEAMGQPAVLKTLREAP